MNLLEALIILAVGSTGLFLYLRMVADNRRTRPERARQALRQRLRRHGMSEDRIDALIARTL